MFEKVLSPTAKKSLAVLAEIPVIKSAYLAGGTALALQLGHRYSYDFDFFTAEKFDERTVVQQLAEVLPDFKLEQETWRTVLGFIKNVKFSLFFYKYPLLFPVREFKELKLADAKDIAAMKVAAISDRGTKRDFIDLYFLLKEKHIASIEKALDMYEAKFGKLSQNKFHIIKSLGYFDDAEQEKMPQMIKRVLWKDVKLFFAREQKRIAKLLI